MNERLELFTPLAPQECIKRLSEALEWSGAAIVSRPPVNPIGREVIRGTVESDHFELYHAHGSKSATCLCATLQPCDGGTLISGHFFVPRIGRVFGAIFRFLVCLWGSIPAALILYAVFQGTLTDWFTIMTTLVLSLGCASVLCMFIRYVLRVQPEVLIVFLRSILEAETPSITPPE